MTSPLRPGRLFLTECLEPLIRLGSWLAYLLGRDREGVEMVLRGRTLGGGRKLRIGRNVHLVGPPAQIRLGRGVTLFGNIFLNANGQKGEVVIEEGTHIDQYCVLYGQGGLTIGRHCAIAAGTILYSQTNADGSFDATPVSLQPIAFARVELGDGCWLGAGVRVLPGAVIGAGSHVGAGAVVTRSIPPGVVAVGVPARVISERPR